MLYSESSVKCYYEGGGFVFGASETRHVVEEDSVPQMKFGGIAKHGVKGYILVLYPMTQFTDDGVDFFLKIFFYFPFLGGCCLGDHIAGGIFIDIWLIFVEEVFPFSWANEGDF